MEVLTGYCKGCKAELIRGKNSWNGIGTTYFSPVYAPLSTRGIACIGEVYEATRGTRVENSQLRDVTCIKCKAMVGVRCENSPDGHLLQSGQWLLKLSEMAMISEGSGRPAKISVLQSVTLSNAHSKKLLASRRASTVQPSPRALPPHLQPKAAVTPGPHGRMSVHPEYKKPPNVNGLSTRLDPSREPVGTALLVNQSLSTTQPRPSQIQNRDERFKTATKSSSTGASPAQAERADSQAKLEKFKSWAETTFSTQQKDIDRISGAIERIEGGMRSLQDLIQEVRTELSSSGQAQELKRKEDQKETRKVIAQLQRRIGDRSEDLDCQIQQFERQNELFELNRTNYEDNLKGMKREVSQLKLKMDKGDINFDLKSATILLGEKLELMSRDVSRVGKKTTAVEDLKILLEEVAGRLQQVEKAMITHLAPQLPEYDVPVGQLESEPNHKRKQVQIDTTRTPSVACSPDLPTKRRRLRDPRSKAVDLTSDVPSPILGSQINIPFQDGSTISGEKKNESPHVVIYLPTSPIEPGIVLPATYAIRPQTAEAPTSEQEPVRKLVTDPMNRRRVPLRGFEPRKDSSGRWRDSDGNILLKDGTIDRRSLRYKNNVSAPMPHFVTQDRSEKEAQPVMQTVEQVDVVSITCSECGKSWKSIERFNEHRCVSEKVEVARKARIDARERLVRATLERELYDEL